MHYLILTFSNWSKQFNWSSKEDVISRFSFALRRASTCNLLEDDEISSEERPGEFSASIFLRLERMMQAFEMQVTRIRI